MTAQRKGPVSWQGQPTQTTSLSRKVCTKYAPSAQLWQALIGGVLGAAITFLAINAAAVAHMIANWGRL
jgi:hypothetical protein